MLTKLYEAVLKKILQGIFMAACGILLVTYFDRDLLKIYDSECNGLGSRRKDITSISPSLEEIHLTAVGSNNYKSLVSITDRRKNTKRSISQHQPSIVELISSLLGSVPFNLSCILSSCI